VQKEEQWEIGWGSGNSYFCHCALDGTFELARTMLVSGVGLLGLSFVPSSEAVIYLNLELSD
jgi:hypothetical protein